jgi:integrase
MDFDLAQGIWTIPAQAMKGGVEHRAPLSSAALNLLEKQARVHDNNLVFPSPTGKVLSDAAMNQVLIRMEVTATVHGFRSTFRDWVAEETAYSREVAEMALAHKIPDKVEAAYRRGDLFAKRKQLMEDWASYCGAAT